MEQKDPEKLFEKYRAGTLTEAERILLESWYLQLSKQKNVEVDGSDFPNVDAFWERLSENTGRHRVIASHANPPVALRRWLVAASVAIICGFAGLYYYSGAHFFSDTSTATIHHQTANQETKQVELPDGTRVWLNAGSKLHHPESFEDDVRHVELQGEAYFEVAHDPERPFIIKSGEFQTRVIGTSFNVSAYPEDVNFEVAVLSGKVAVSSDKAETKGFETFLTAKQRIYYNHSSNTLRSFEDAHTEEAIAWRQGKMIYRNTPLREVLPDLERKYNVRLTANPEILRCSIYLKLNNEPLEKVLKVLAELVDGKVTRNGASYYLKGKPCKAK